MSIDDPVEFVAERIYAGYGARTPWAEANEEIRKIARKDAKSAIDAMEAMNGAAAASAVLAQDNAEPRI